MPGFYNKLIKSFAHASHGIIYLFKSQANARIELFIALLVLCAGILFRVSRFEWLIILTMIALVLALEGINTAIEILCDKLHPAADPKIKNVKDAAAGAVLIVAVISVIVGFIIFVPKFISLVTN